MKFQEAYERAMADNKFRAHDAAVKEALENGEQSSCLLFTVGNGEVFYYGFDGCTMHKGKHSQKRAEYLLKNNRVYEI